MKLKIFHYILTTISAIVLVACAGRSSDVTDEPLPVTPDHEERPMLFASPAAVNPSLSRDATPFADRATAFKVWGYKLNSALVTQTVIPAYWVKYIDAAWQYKADADPSDADIASQYLKYWDASALRYDFYSYDPLTPADGITVTVDAADGIKIEGLTAHTATAPDLLVAHQVRHLADEGAPRDVDAITGVDNTVQPAVFYDDVPMVFHRLLSRVEFRVYNTGTLPADITQIAIELDADKAFYTAGTYQDDTWTLTDPARYLVNNYYATPYNLVIDPIPAVNYKTLATVVSTRYEIPQTFDKHINVTLTVNGVDITGSFDLTEAWRQDIDYIYYIHISVGDGDPILIGLDVADFVQGEIFGTTLEDW